MPKIASEEHMEVVINDDWKITTDKWNFIVEKRSVVTKKGSANLGKSFWKQEAYYPTLEQAFNAIVDRCLWRTRSDSMEDILDLLREVQTDIKNCRERLTIQKGD